MNSFSSDPETFRTIVTVNKHNGPLLQHNDSVLLMGSCFSDNIGERLKQARIDTVVNPFGISFNPLALAHSLTRLAQDKFYTLADLDRDGSGRYCSFDHHTQYSDVDPDVCLASINHDFEQGSAQLRKAKYLFLTLGTSWCFAHRDRKPGQCAAVANCHKRPGGEFVRWMASPSESTQALASAVRACRAANPGLQVVLTVSPVRHWREGAIQNGRSKAALLLAADNLASAGLPGVSYFPSYELVMDDLRDYRFFEADMVHPSRVAIDYVWARLLDCFFDDTDDRGSGGGAGGAGRRSVRSRRALADFEALHRALAHRPLSCASESTSLFARSQLDILAGLEAGYPYVDLSAERAYFQGLEAASSPSKLQLNPK